MSPFSNLSNLDQLQILRLKLELANYFQTAYKWEVNQCVSMAESAINTGLIHAEIEKSRY